MQWEGKIGPAFVVTVALAVLTALGWFTDGRASVLWTERIVRLETQVQSIIVTNTRIENKIDTLNTIKNNSQNGR